MSKKRIALLCGIVILAIVWIVQLVQNSGNGITVLKLKEDATEFIIEQPDVDPIVLTFSKSVPANSDDPDGEQVEQWLINGKDVAATEKIDMIKKAMESIKVLGTVSSANDLSTYELDENNAVTITAKHDDKIVRTLVLGKESSTGSQTYSQIDGDSDIVLIAGTPGTNFPLTAEDLLPPPPAEDDDSTTSGTNKSETANTSAQANIKAE
ncbi:MAG: hypothetical protein BKP49_04540 [Treponema sp. CETP13]|nr:MAG: hypothetical protein BKP49_04540 [Treponema sp. CETP13]